MADLGDIVQLSSTGVAHIYSSGWNEIKAATLVDGAVLEGSISLNGAINYLPDTGTVLQFDGQAVIKRLTANGGMLLGHDEAMLIGAGEAGGQLEANVSHSGEKLWLGAEAGVHIVTSPDNWDTAWAGAYQWDFNSTGHTLIPGRLYMEYHTSDSGISNNFTNGYLRLAGGDEPNTGANLIMYGQAHASAPYDFKFRYNTTDVMHYDYSAGRIYVRDSIGLTVDAGSLVATSGANRLGAFYLGDTDETYVYNSAANNLSIRTGAFGAYKYFSFETDGYLKASSGGFTVGAEGAGLIRNVDTSYNRVSGGNAVGSGANFVLYGGTHASAANDLQIRTGATTWFQYDDSIDRLTIQNGVDLWLSTGDINVAAGDVSAVAGTFTGKLYVPRSPGLGVAADLLHLRHADEATDLVFRSNGSTIFDVRSEAGGAGNSYMAFVNGTYVSFAYSGITALQTNSTYGFTSYGDSFIQGELEIGTAAINGAIHVRPIPYSSNQTQAGITISDRANTWNFLIGIASDSAGSPRLVLTNHAGTPQIEMANSVLGMTAPLQILNSANVFLNDYMYMVGSGTNAREYRAYNTLGGAGVGVSGTGNVFLTQLTSSGVWEKNVLHATRNAGVILYYNGTQALATNSSFGVTVAGASSIAGHLTMSSSGEIRLIDGTAADPAINFNTQQGTGFFYLAPGSDGQAHSAIGVTAQSAEAMSMGIWSSADVDIDGLISGSAFGTLIMGRESSHFTIALRDNDTSDGFQVISGGGGSGTAFMDDSTWDTLCFEVKATGAGTFASSLGIGGDLTFNGLYHPVYAPGSNVDTLIFQVSVTGTPYMEFQYSNNRFFLSDGVYSPLLESSGGVIAGTTITAGNTITINNGSPTLAMDETDGTTAIRESWLHRASDSLYLQTRSSGGVFVSSDYRMTLGGSGATKHEWFIGGASDSGFSIDSTTLVSHKTIEAANTVLADSPGSSSYGTFAFSNGGLVSAEIKYGHSAAADASTMLFNVGTSLTTVMSLTTSTMKFFEDTAGATGVEYGKPGDNNTRHIDFHTSASSTDYDSRILASGGGASAGGGVLYLQADAIITTKVRPLAANTYDLGEDATLDYRDAYVRNGVTTGSDISLKKNLVKIDPAKASEIIHGLTATLFNYIDDSPNEAKSGGLIAHEAIKVFEAAGIDPRSTKVFSFDRKTGRWGIRYGALIPYIIAAMQNK